MTAARSVVIGLPARDERDVIAACLDGVRGAIRHARERRLVDRAVVVVGAHRCRDDTAAVASRLVRRFGIVGEVLVDNGSTTVGMVRDRVARRGLTRLRLGATATRADSSWVLSTDADTVVGEDWIESIVDAADRCRAVCVVGLAALDEWRGGVAGENAYAELLRARFRDGPAGDEHDHVYGANLAIRADAYLAVGGFPHAGHGEDQQLVDILAALGYRIARTRAVSVTTSGRTAGRAADGLADLLRRLDRDSYEAETEGRGSRRPDPAGAGPESSGLEPAASVGP